MTNKLFIILISLSLYISCGKDDEDCSKSSVSSSLCDESDVQGATDEIAGLNGPGAVLELSDVVNGNTSHSLKGYCNISSQTVTITAVNMSPSTITAVCDGIVFDTATTTVSFTGVNGSSEQLDVAITDLDGNSISSQKQVLIDSYVPNHSIQNPTSIASSGVSVISGICDESGSKVSITGPFQPSPVISVCSGSTFSTPPVTFTGAAGPAVLNSKIEDLVGNLSTTSFSFNIL